MNGIGRLVSRSAIALAIILAAGPSALTAGRDDTVVDPEIAGPPRAEAGAWRSKVQQVFDPQTQTLSRRMYTIWDAEPSRDLDFIWTPDRPQADKEGRINGSGLLLWRIKGKPTYDPAAIVAQYRGTIRDGRIEGTGVYLDSSGLYYEGEWKAGLMHGQGRLQLPSGDEYVGQFRAGRADGNGRYIDATGEIYEGPFANGQRHGRGSMTLPNGRTYSSLWTRGREDENSHLIRLAQAGSRLPKQSDDIRIGITLDKRLPPSSRTDDSELRKGDLWYALSNAANGLLIRPDGKRLISVWKGGGQIQLTKDESNKNFDSFGVVSFVKGQLVPLNLLVEVQNRSSNPIDIVGVSVDVDSSVTDLQPALQMSEESAFADSVFEGYYHPFYFIENFGWGTANKAKLNFAFQNAGAGPKKATARRSQDLGDIERSAKVDFEPQLASLGADLNALKRNGADGFPCKSKNRAACLRDIKAAGTFGSLADLVSLDEIGIVIGVVGELEYEWLDSAGKTNKATSPFSIKLFVGMLMTDVELGEGGSREIIARDTQQFRLDGTNYRLPISYRTNVPGGRTARLVVPLEAQKSSTHDFKVAVQLSDGREIKSRPINLLYYRPRWFTPSAFERAPLPDDLARDNYDMVANDLRKIQGKDLDQYQCDRTCEAEPNCRGFAHDKWNNTCFLKSAIGMLRLDPQFASGRKSDTPAPTQSTAAKVMQRYRDTAFPGFGYLIHQQIDVDKCEKLCVADDHCVAFTFKKQAQDCSLFDTTPGRSANPDAESGVKRQPER